MSLYKVFDKLLKKVRDKNEMDVDVKTAEQAVFDEVQRKIDEMEREKEMASRPKTRADIYKEYRDKVREAQVENEADPQVETAHTSVYDDIMRELEKQRQEQEMKNREEVHQRSSTHEPIREFDPVGNSGPLYTPPPANTHRGARAMTNSEGSLALREFPKMDARQSKVRVPSQTLLTILEYSENSINLDGRKSRFVLVEYGGQRGWILDSYLNFS